MKIDKIIISKHAAEHIKKHGLEKREVVEAIRGKQIYVKRAKSKTPAKSRYYIVGKTMGGCFITIIVERVVDAIFQLITARPSTSREKTLYKRREGV